ncbi:MAG TPA: hypothetical protein VMI54_23110, partial [Polyangiaceae bacterium]|nr:hypothetical protein [Polyangiaceae bacterium]
MKRGRHVGFALLFLGATAFGCGDTSRHFKTPDGSAGAAGSGGNGGAAGSGRSGGAAGLGRNGGAGGSGQSGSSAELGGSGGSGDVAGQSSGSGASSGTDQGTDAGASGSAGDATAGGGAGGAGGTSTTLADGTACKEDADCTNAHCIDGVCCATTCAGCDACVKDLTGQPDGTCAPVVSGKDPHDFCADETATNQCGNDGTCDGASGCRNVGAGVECSPAMCSSDGKTYTPAANCDGAGQCSTVTGQDCGNAPCTVMNGCLTNCTSSSQCRTGFYCDISSGTCTTQKKNGTTATDVGQCASGIIADGVCCDKQCAGCSACTLALNHQTGSAADGQCLAVQPGVAAPHNACPTSSSAPCGPDGTCDGANACRAPAVGSSCGTTSCTGSTLTTNTCDGSQNCATKAAACPNSLECNTAKTGCLGSCSKDADCAMGYCVAGSCASTRRVGDSCGGPSECPNGYCVDGYCCNAQCGGDCQSCSQTPGTCKTLTTPRTSCTGSGTCGKKYCDGTHTSCVFPDSSTACPNQCSSDWSAVVSSSCDGAGNCGTGMSNNCSGSQYCSTSNNQCVA